MVCWSNSWDIVFNQGFECVSPPLKSEGVTTYQVTCRAHTTSRIVRKHQERSTAHSKKKRTLFTIPVSRNIFFSSSQQQKQNSFFFNDQLWCSCADRTHGFEYLRNRSVLLPHALYIGSKASVQPTLPDVTPYNQLPLLD
uniref:Uncharacterized protein n=1 Tax=Cacopsylla melanoneura TaxID=428564 RepID=A0A8D8TCY6_9HEMI